jgi:hypothetical protein
VSEAADLGSRTARLAAGLADERSITVRLDRLWEVFARTSPDVAREPAKRQLLHDSISELEAAKHIILPKGLRHWDRTGHPPLPSFVRRNVDRLPSTAMRDRLRYPWAPELAWAASERLTTAQREALIAISVWITRHPSRPEALPHRERSLEIFGHEKRLDELMPTPLFGPGRLTLEMLAAYVVHPPFVWHSIEESTGSELLVIENHNTYDSVCRAVVHHASAGTRPSFRHVAYGAGGAFEASVSYVGDLDPQPARVRYFGDLDTEGISIPTRASARARAAGLPPVEPHHLLYRLLLTHGRPQPATSQPSSTDWLGPLRDPVDVLLSSGHRLAQEWVNLSILQDDRTWLKD